MQVPTKNKCKPSPVLRKRFNFNFGTSSSVHSWATTALSLELTWESRAGSELKWDEAPQSEDRVLTLPTLHASKCVQLLKLCKRLEFLRLYFESDLIINISSDAFRNNPGIRELCSVRGIKKVQIWDLGHEPIEQLGLAKWLKGEIESHEEGGEKREGNWKTRLRSMSRGYPSRSGKGGE